MFLHEPRVPFLGGHSQELLFVVRAHAEPVKEQNRNFVRSPKKRKNRGSFQGAL